MWWRRGPFEIGNVARVELSNHWSLIPPLERIAQRSSVFCLPLVCLGSQLRLLVILSSGDVIKNVAVKLCFCDHLLNEKAAGAVGAIRAS